MLCTWTETLKARDFAEFELASDLAGDTDLLLFRVMVPVGLNVEGTDDTDCGAFPLSFPLPFPPPMDTPLGMISDDASFNAWDEMLHILRSNPFYTSCDVIARKTLDGRRERYIIAERAVEGREERRKNGGKTLEELCRTQPKLTMGSHETEERRTKR